MPYDQGLHAICSRALCHMIKGFMPCVQGLYANMFKSLMLLYSRALCHSVQGLQAIMFQDKTGPKAGMKLVQNQLTLCPLIYVCIEMCYNSS